jgi:hypothetical protein
MDDFRFDGGGRTSIDLKPAVRLYKDTSRADSLPPDGVGLIGMLCGKRLPRDKPRDAIFGLLTGYELD